MSRMDESQPEPIPNAGIVIDEAGAMWFQLNIPGALGQLAVRFGEAGAQQLADGLQTYLNLCEEQRALDALALSEPGGH